jgi:uncharacterized protein
MSNPVIPTWAASAEYINLITFKKDGSRVSTPVWFVLVDGKLVIYSNLNAGKMKRIRNNEKVEVGPCTVKGKPIGDTVVAIAKELDSSKSSYVHGALNKKYGWKKKLMSFFSVVPEKLHIKKASPDGYIEVSFLEGQINSCWTLPS